MPETLKNCPLCEHAESTGLATEKARITHESLNAPLGYRICGRCGLVFQSPRMTEEELDAFYAYDFRDVVSDEDITEPTRKEMFVQSGRSAYLAAFMTGEITEVKAHLDIGCSTGVFLQQSRQRYGCQIVGIEPGRLYRSFARAQGVPVFPSMDYLEETGPGRFDLVSMVHVLEHLPDPVPALKYLRENTLAPGGELLVEVPNLYAHDSFEIAHLTAFSPHSLREALKKAGFSIRKLRIHGDPRSKILPLYITALAAPEAAPKPSPVRPEYAVAFKRRAGMLLRRVVQRLFPRAAWLPLPQD